MLIDFKVNSKRIERAFQALHDFPTEDYMRDLARLIQVRNGRRFAREVGPDGRKWKRWSKSYRKSGAPFHANHRRLHLSGALAMSINVPPSSLRRDSAEVGYSDPKARWHHEGVGRLPIREVIGVNSGDVVAAGKQGIRHLESRIRA